MSPSHAVSTASITIDMDELDVLQAGYGLPGPVTPKVYDRSVPRMLELFNGLGVKVTFFVIAKDAAVPLHRQRIREMVAAGHEIGNHSLRHEHLLGMDRKETRRDVEESTAILEDVAGAPVVGYRGPSLTLNNHLHDLLSQRGYLYDSTVNPTYFFLGEWLYLTLCHPGKRNRPDLFFARHALAPNHPYRLSRRSFFASAPHGSLLELPISNTPWLRIPYYPTFHFLLPFFRPLCRTLFLKNRAPIFLAHGLDFLDEYKDGLDPGYRKHPGIAMPYTRKAAYFREVITDLTSNYLVVPARETAAQLLAGGL